MSRNAARASAKRRAELVRDRRISASVHKLQAEHEEALVQREAEIYGAIYDRQRGAYHEMVGALCRETLGIDDSVRLCNNIVGLDTAFAPQFAAAADIGQRDMAHARYRCAVTASAGMASQIENRKASDHFTVVKFLLRLARLNAAWAPENLGVAGDDYRVGLAYDAANGAGSLDLEVEAA